MRSTTALLLIVSPRLEFGNFQVTAATAHWGEQGSFRRPTGPTNCRKWSHSHGYPSSFSSVSDVHKHSCLTSRCAFLLFFLLPSVVIRSFCYITPCGNRNTELLAGHYWSVHHSIFSNEYELKQHHDDSLRSDPNSR